MKAGSPVPLGYGLDGPVYDGLTHGGSPIAGTKGDPAMQILALDVGKSKSVAYAVDLKTGECGFTTVRTRARHRGARLRQGIAPLRRGEARLVMEIGPMAGWIGDLARASGIRRVQVAHVGHEAWR